MKISKDKLVSIFFIVISVIILGFAQQIRVLPNLSEPGPRLFPMVGAIGMIACGIGIFFTKEDKDAAGKEKVYLTGEGWKRLGVIFGVIVLYILGLTYLGFLISTPFAMLGFIAVLRSGEKVSKVVSVIIAIAVTAILWFVFEKAFVIPLPPGKIF